MYKPFFIIKNREFDLQKFDQLYKPKDKILCWEKRYFIASNIKLQQQFLFYNHTLQILLLCQLNNDTVFNDSTYGELFCADIISHYRIRKKIFFYNMHQHNGTKFFDIKRKSHQKRVRILKKFFLDPKIQLFLSDIKIEKHYVW